MAPLTQKYRPKTFSAVVGQPLALKLLEGCLVDTPPTILLTGPRGSGKTTNARILARALNCTERTGVDPCGACPSCAEKQHPDILEINAADSRGIDMIRSLAQIARLVPRFKRRVVICDEVHAITAQSGQAALKLFEEPPRTVTFVLATTDPDKLPETIRSRCTRIEMKAVQSDVLIEHVRTVASKEGFKLSDEACREITFAARGSVREALVLLQQVLSSGVKAKDIQGLDKVVQQLVQSTPVAISLTFLQAVMDCNLKAAFTQASQAETPEFLIHSAVELLQAAVRYKVNPQSVEGAFRARLNTLGKLHIRDLAAVLKLFAEAQARVKSYQMDASVALDLAIVAAIPEK